MSPDPAFATEPLDLRWVDGHTWIVRDEFNYTPASGHVVIVPAETPTDFASIPRVFWAVLPPTGVYGKAAVLHDFLYQKGRWTLDGDVCSRGDADRVLHDAMFDLGVPDWQIRVIFYGVRVGGWKSWNRYRKLDANKGLNLQCGKQSSSRT